MDHFIDGQNPYGLLGLENGQQSTLQDIKTAYRRLVLVIHPDKAKGDKAEAARKFDEVQKAYAILCDKSARGALDDYLEAQAHRERRLAQQDVKRQKLRQELERKEREGEKTRSEEEQARARLKVELEALRARAQQEQREKQQHHAAAAAAAAAARASSSAGAGPSGTPAAAAAAAAGAGAAATVDDDDDETTELLKRTVKVTWDPSVGSYTTDRLRELFGSKFLVEDVILKDSRKKRKASALVVLDSVAAAGQAAHEVLGDLKNPLLVTPYFKVMPEAGQAQQQPAAGTQGGGAGSAGAGSPAAGGSRRPGGTPLFPGAGAAAGGGGGKPVQRPSKPLFPSAQPAPPAAAAKGDTAANGTAAAGGGGAAAGGSGQPKSFSSFPGMPPAAGGGGSSGKGFSSFPGMPTGGFEQSVLQKLQQKSQNKQ